MTEEQPGFVAVNDVLAQTGMSHDALYRRRMAGELTIYAHPTDRRIRLLRTEDAARLVTPQPIVGRTVRPVAAPGT